MENTLEIWSSIEGLESSFEVSNQGRVRSLSRVITCKNNKTLSIKGQIIKLNHVNGYYDVKLKKKHYLIHRLVAKAFINNPENKPQVNHIDSDKSNNHCSNLEWNTSTENIAHSMKQGTHPKGESSGTSKLTEKDIPEIFELRIKGLSYEKIARIYSIDQSLVPKILNRKLWKHVSIVLSILLLFSSSSSAQGGKSSSDTIRCYGIKELQNIAATVEFANSCDTLLSNALLRVINKDKRINEKIIQVDNLTKQISYKDTLIKNRENKIKELDDEIIKLNKHKKILKIAWVSTSAFLFGLFIFFTR